MWHRLWTLCIALLTAGPVGAVSVSVRDDTGAQVRLPNPAQRVVSLSPALTETLYHIGAGALVVGVDLASDFPPPAAQLPRLGTVAGIDRERLLALNPDLVLVWGDGARAGFVEWLRDAGMAVYVSKPHDLEQIATTMERLGRLTGQAQTAVAAAADFRARVATLRHRYERAEPVTVFYQVWHDPLITINGDQFISQVIELCGGRNVFASLQRGAPPVSVEAVLAQDPRFLVAGANEGAHDPLAPWRRWPFLQAVQDGTLVTVPADLLQRPSARLLDGAHQLCERLAASEASPQR